MFNNMYYLNLLSNANKNNFSMTLWFMNLITLLIPYKFLLKSLACLYYWNNLKHLVKMGMELRIRSESECQESNYQDMI